MESEEPMRCDVCRKVYKGIRGLAQHKTRSKCGGVSLSKRARTNEGSAGPSWTKLLPTQIPTSSASVHQYSRRQQPSNNPHAHAQNQHHRSTKEKESYVAFLTLTQTDDDTAFRCLASHNWNLQSALDNTSFQNLHSNHSSSSSKAMLASIDKKKIDALYARYR
ncbi:Defective in cullin neddylation protein, partial [Caligus rogercresseyi]